MKFRCIRYYDPNDGSDRYSLSRIPELGRFAWILNVTVSLTQEQYEAIKDRQLDVTLEPVQTREERLREARLRAFEARNQGMLRALTALEAVEIIERVDAEFAKETRPLESTHPMYCGHANEVPNVCPCSASCYCRQLGNTCQDARVVDS